MNKESKNFRILDMYVQLWKGQPVNKRIAAQKYGVDERSIQRDIDDIRQFLDDRSIRFGASREIIYDRTKKGFVMIGNEPAMMSNSEILAVSKILLESRAFTKKELDEILDKLVEGCVPAKNMKLVSELIANEKFHYVELKHPALSKDMLWELGENIKNHHILEIQYAKGDNPKETIQRLIEPVAILFSEYYFYLNAYIVEETDQKYTHKYDYPAIFRIDRIKSCRDTKIRFQIPYASRFEEGEFRKRIQFMYAGKLMTIRMKYFGKNPEAVLDRLPTAKIIEKQENETLIEAEVYGKGIVMWLLSQGSNIEVLKPESLRLEMQQKIREMLERYSS